MNSHSHSRLGRSIYTTGEREQKLELTIRKSMTFWGKTSIDIASIMEHLTTELNKFQCNQSEFHKSIISTYNRGRPQLLKKAVYEILFSSQSKTTHFKMRLEQEFKLWQQVKLEWFKPLIDADFVNMTMEELQAMAEKCKDGEKIATERNAVFENLKEKWNPLKIELCAGMDDCFSRVLTQNGQNTEKFGEMAIVP